MGTRKWDFSEADKVRVLLWSARHCCLCGKQAGIGIEVAHLDPKSSDLDNAMPLCFDCHAAIGHYNSQHPRGRKYSIPELKARRDQVYEEHTRHLVPPIRYLLRQDGRPLPDVGFHIENLGSTYPVRARVKVTLAQGDRSFAASGVGHYDGNHLWNLNPGFGVHGHFTATDYQAASADPLRARVDVTIVDIYERPHPLLAVGYKIDPASREWYLEPSEETLQIP